MKYKKYITIAFYYSLYIVAIGIGVVYNKIKRLKKQKQTK